MDFTITEVNTNRHRVENDSCLTRVVIAEHLCWEKVIAEEHGVPLALSLKVSLAQPAFCSLSVSLLLFVSLCERSTLTNSNLSQIPKQYNNSWNIIKMSMKWMDVLVWVSHFCFSVTVNSWGQDMRSRSSCNFGNSVLLFWCELLRIDTFLCCGFTSVGCQTFFHHYLQLCFPAALS